MMYRIYRKRPGNTNGMLIMTADILEPLTSDETASQFSRKGGVGTIIAALPVATVTCARIGQFDRTPNVES